MLKWKNAWYQAAVGAIILVVALMGCVTPQESDQTVSPLYMLTTAGFKPWAVNMDTPKREALLNSIPRGKIVTYQMNGVTYYVYAEQNANTLYVGDSRAYQKYNSMTHGKNYCERVKGENQQQFWRCFEEFQREGPQLPKQ